MGMYHHDSHVTSGRPQPNCLTKETGEEEEEAKWIRQANSATIRTEPYVPPLPNPLMIGRI